MRASALLGLLSLLLLGGCGAQRDGVAPPPPIRGRVVGPDGVDLRGLWVFASEDDRSLPVAAPVQDAAFELRVSKPVDLQVGVGPARLDLNDIDRLARQIQEADRLVYTVGTRFGCVRGVEPGTQGVEIVLRPFETRDVVVTVVDPSGAAVEGSEVQLISLADLIRGVTTDANGRATVTDVPDGRRWRATASAPPALRRQFDVLNGSATVEEDATAVTVPLVAGVPICVQMDFELPEEGFLAYGEAGANTVGTWGWERTANGGRARLLVYPEWGEVVVRLHATVESTPSSVASRVVASGRGSVRAGAIVELRREP